MSVTTLHKRHCQLGCCSPPASASSRCRSARAGIARLRAQNRRLRDAIDNMSQGLSMFDAQTRIVLVNRRYLEMYKLSPDIVKPGCTLRELIQHRKETGLFVDDVDAYCQRIIDSMQNGASTPHLRAGERRPHRARQERAAARRRLGLDARGRHRAAPRRGRARGDPRAGAAPLGHRCRDRRLPADRPSGCSAASATAPPPCARRRTRCSASPSRPRRAPTAPCRRSTRRRPMSIPRRSPTDELSHSIAEISRQLTQTGDIVAHATEEARADRRARSPGLPPARRRSATSSS